MIRPNPDEEFVFIGEEQEGVHKGRLTLFVVGQPNVVEVQSKIKQLGVKAVYFGAGFLSEVSTEYILVVMTDLIIGRPLDVVFETSNRLEAENFAAADLPHRTLVLTLMLEGQPTGLTLEGLDLGTTLEVFVKFDFEQKTYVASLHEISVSSYAGYQQDRRI